MQKELLELDVPEHASVSFPNTDDIMNFELMVNLNEESCIWRGGKYKFVIEVSGNYPYDAPKCKCVT